MAHAVCYGFCYERCYERCYGGRGASTAANPPPPLSRTPRESTPPSPLPTLATPTTPGCGAGEVARPPSGHPTRARRWGAAAGDAGAHARPASAPPTQYERPPLPAGAHSRSSLPAGAGGEVRRRGGVPRAGAAGAPTVDPRATPPPLTCLHPFRPTPTPPTPPRGGSDRVASPGGCAATGCGGMLREAAPCGGAAAAGARTISWRACSLSPMPEGRSPSPPHRRVEEHHARGFREWGGESPRTWTCCRGGASTYDCAGCVANGCRRRLCARSLHHIHCSFTR